MLPRFMLARSIGVSTAPGKMALTRILSAANSMAMARVNASKPPGEWQCFDVIYRAPRFDSAGHKTRNASFEKVSHNGTTVQENIELLGPTRVGLPEQARGPLRLQGDHGPVAYRNLRVRPI